MHIIVSVLLTVVHIEYAYSTHVVHMYANCINIVTCAVYAVLVYYVCMYCMYVAMYVRGLC